MEIITATIYISIVVIGGRFIGLPIYAIVLISVLGLFEVMRHFRNLSEIDLQAKVYVQNSECSTVCHSSVSERIPEGRIPEERISKTMPEDRA